MCVEVDVAEVRGLKDEEKKREEGKKGKRRLEKREDGCGEVAKFL